MLQEEMYAGQRTERHRGQTHCHASRLIGHTAFSPVYREYGGPAFKSGNPQGLYRILFPSWGRALPLPPPGPLYLHDRFEGRIYSVLDLDEGGEHDAHRVLGPDSFSYIRVLVERHPASPYHRVDLSLLDTTQATATLSINRGMHEEIFQEWVKIFAPL